MVIERACRRYEYCLVHEDKAVFPHKIVHTMSRKQAAPLVLATINYFGRPIRLFDPRRDSWDEHFKLDEPIIQPVSPIGEVIVRMLRLNAAERVIKRRLFQALGSYRKA
jgi:hypothetical protein